MIVMPDPRIVAAGMIRYEIGFVENPRHHGARGGLFSSELNAMIRRRNVPESRVVYFNGRHARTEEINVDYGVRSRSIELRVAGRETITRCKELTNFGFCVEYPSGLPAGGPPPHLAPTDETATIAGLHCRKGEYVGNRHLFIWYTEEIVVNDPTGAILTFDGVPGLILQTETIPDADGLIERTTVTELSFDAPPSGIFSMPQGYRMFESVDAARAEDRRLLDTNAAEELERDPLGPDERDMFIGTWLFDTEKDRIRVEITRADDNELRFRTTVLTAPEGAAGRVTDEKAAMKGRLLMVEEPPNYRLYRLGEDGGSLRQVGNDLFAFTRS